MALTVAERALVPMDEGMLEYFDASGVKRRHMVAAARQEYTKFRVPYGYTKWSRLLTPPENQVKLHKSMRPTYGLSLVPSVALGVVDLPGIGSRPVNLCPMATKACEADCLGVTSGHQVFGSVQKAQAVRTRWLLAEPFWGGVLLAAELVAASEAKGSIMFRPNVISDIRWELVIGRALRRAKAMLDLGVYDYTKYLPKARSGAAGLGYDLTYSFHDKMSRATAQWLMGSGYRVAVVFKDRSTTSPKVLKQMVRDAVAADGTWEGFPLVDGVSTDDRSLDPGGVAVALAGLGAAARWESKLSVPFSEIRF